jgi:hypothetical protein
MKKLKGRNGWLDLKSLPESNADSKELSQSLLLIFNDYSSDS